MSSKCRTHDSTSSRLARARYEMARPAHDGDRECTGRSTTPAGIVDGIVDGILACTALVLILTSYFGDRRIVES